MNQTENEYRQWLIDLKKKIRQSQIKAAVKVNVELLRFYWDLGRDIVVRQMETIWGSRFFERLSKDLRKEFPDMKGFSVVNLTYCKRFYLFYTQDNSILQQVVEEFDNHPFFQAPWVWSVKNEGVHFSKDVHKFHWHKTSLLPNLKNKTTSVELIQPPSFTSLPHYHTFNEVMRLFFPVVIFLLRLFCIENEVKIWFCNSPKYNL
jgi:hypothetical protein